MLYRMQKNMSSKHIRNSWILCFARSNTITAECSDKEVGQVTEQREQFKQIYNALVEKGYSPERQLVGFLTTGDPTYITAHNGARIIAGKLDVEHLLSDIVLDYFKR